MAIRYTQREYQRFAVDRRKEIAERWRTQAAEPSEEQRTPGSGRGSLAEWIIVAPIAIAGVVGVVVGAAAFIAAVAAMAILPIVLLSRALGLPRAWDAGLPALLGVAAVLVVLILRIATRPRRCARDLVSLSLCGACGYRIDQVRSAEDRITECPECGAAWELAPIESSACLNCSARLAGTPVGEDGIVWCPECGAPHGLHAADVDT